MKRIVWVTLCLLITMAVSAQEKRILRGFDGGMMVHTGYLSGNLDAIGYKAQGAPMGIGGVIRLHLGDHFRIGSEGSGKDPALCRLYPGRRCDFIVTGPMHLTLKVDYLCAVDKSKLLPDGPRVYIGFLFYH